MRGSWFASGRPGHKAAGMGNWISGFSRTPWNRPWSEQCCPAFLPNLSGCVCFLRNTRRTARPQNRCNCYRRYNPQTLTNHRKRLRTPISGQKRSFPDCVFVAGIRNVCGDSIQKKEPAAVGGRLDDFWRLKQLRAVAKGNLRRRRTRTLTQSQRVVRVA